MTAIVMKKDLATMFLETVLVRKAGMVLMTAHFVSLGSMFHFKKVIFLVSPSSDQLEPILFIFGTNIWQNNTNYFCTNFKQEHFKFYVWPMITFVEVAIEVTLNQMDFVHLLKKKHASKWQIPLGFKF